MGESSANASAQGGPTGENLAAGYANATASVDAWGLERTDYNFKKPTGFSEKTGHFTQLVWGNTTSVGCAVESCQGENGMFTLLSLLFWRELRVGEEKEV